MKKIVSCFIAFFLLSILLNASDNDSVKEVTIDSLKNKNVVEMTEQEFEEYKRKNEELKKKIEIKKEEVAKRNTPKYNMTEVVIKNDEEKSFIKESIKVAPVKPILKQDVVEIVMKQEEPLVIKEEIKPIIPKVVEPNPIIVKVEPQKTVAEPIKPIVQEVVSKKEEKVIEQTKTAPIVAVTQDINIKPPLKTEEIKPTVIQKEEAKKEAKVEEVKPLIAQKDETKVENRKVEKPISAEEKKVVKPEQLGNIGELIALSLEGSIEYLLQKGNQLNVFEFEQSKQILFEKIRDDGRFDKEALVSMNVTLLNKMEFIDFVREVKTAIKLRN